jgi:hypothetical protein
MLRLHIQVRTIGVLDRKICELTPVDNSKDQKYLLLSFDVDFDAGGIIDMELLLRYDLASDRFVQRE